MSYVGIIKKLFEEILRRIFNERDFIRIGGVEMTVSNLIIVLNNIS